MNLRTCTYEHGHKRHIQIGVNTSHDPNTYLRLYHKLFPIIHLCGVMHYYSFLVSTFCNRSDIIRYRCLADIFNATCDIILSVYIQ